MVFQLKTTHRDTERCSVHSSVCMHQTTKSLKKKAHYIVPAMACIIDISFWIFLLSQCDFLFYSSILHLPVDTFMASKFCFSFFFSCHEYKQSQ